MLVNLPELEGCDTGFAVVESGNFASNCAIQPLDAQINHTVSRQPKFEETVAQGGNRSVDKGFPVLIDR